MSSGYTDAEHLKLDPQLAAPFKKRGIPKLPLPTHRTRSLPHHARTVGVWLQSNLSGREHVKRASAAASQTVGALAAIAGSTWRLRLEQLRDIYRAVVVPQLLHAVSAWMPPVSERPHIVTRQHAITEMNRVQKRALCLATWAFRTSARMALEQELGVEPIEVTAIK